MKKFSLVLFLLSIQNVCILYQAKAQTFNPNLALLLQSTLDSMVTLFPNTKGMSASVYYPGQGIWKGSSGVSYAGHPITIDMEFGIASNTKLFVSTVLLKLAERNIIHLDDSIYHYVPSYNNINPNITIRQLLNHSSGVSDPFFTASLLDSVIAHPTHVYTIPEVFALIGPPIFAPGNGYSYSNMNYILAGMVAQSATGRHISQLIRDSILTPLQLDSTFYDLKEPVAGILAHRWHLTTDFNDTSRISMNTSGDAAGSIFSTASEMAQWYHALMSGQIINQNSLNQMCTFSAAGNYGLGIAKFTFLGNEAWGHAGSTIGYTSRTVYDPNTKAIVIGLSNADQSAVDGNTVTLYKVLVDKLPHNLASITGQNTVCAGLNNATYTVPAGLNASSYVWTLPSGATGASNTNSITVSFGSNALSGNITVKAINTFGESAVVSFAITVLPPAACNAPLPMTWQKVNGPNEGVNAITSTSTNQLFLGTNNYGVFTSTNDGVSWIPTNQGLNDTLIRHLEASSYNEIFAGTATHGIYKYSNGTWIAINNGLPVTNILTNGFCKGPNGVMYMVATTGVVYKWNGSTWTNIKFNLPSLARMLAVSSNGTLFAGCFNSGVYSYNGSNAWTSLPVMPNSFVTRMVMSISDTLYVSCNSNNTYRIPAAGGAWTSINTGLPALNSTTMSIDANNILYLGFTSNGYGTIYSSSNRGNSWSMVSSSLYTSSFLSSCVSSNGSVYISGAGVYKSSNHGNTWQDMNPGLDARKAIVSFRAKSDGTLFVGTQLSGVWRSTDNGYTWQQKNVGLTTQYSFQITSNAAGDILYSAYIPGSTSVGVLFRSTNNGDSWTQVASNGTDIYTKIKQHLNDTIWAAGRFGGPVLSYSTNNGATWINHPIAGFSAIWDIELAPFSTIFLGSESEGVTRSNDGGNTWTNGVGNTIPWYGNLIEVERDTAGYLFAGTDWYNNILWFSPPGSNGDTWIKFLDPDLNGVNDIYDLVFDNRNNAYLATGNGLYKDPVYKADNTAWNANTDWVSTSNGLPSVAETAEFGFDPTGYMYAAFYQTLKEGGLYRTVLPINDAKLNLKFYIEGYYTGGGLMDPVLYNQSHSNSTSLCDSVTVELHPASTPSIISFSYQGIVATNGTLTCTFPPECNGSSYYIVIKHRNALQTWSANPVLMTTNTAYNFSDSNTKAYGNNQIQIGLGVYTFYSGDLNQDENTDLLDASLLETDINLFQYGYFNTDLNGDGNVDLLDAALLETNINQFIYAIRP